jgi:predicted glycosyltransferase
VTSSIQRDRVVADLSGVTAWIDLASPSHPFFFDGLVDALDGLHPSVTVRDKTETVPLAREVGLHFRTVGKDFENVHLRKLGIPLRTAQLYLAAPDVDVALSARNAMCVLAAKARGVPSIHFTDNDICAYVDGLYAEELYHRLEARATHNVVPEAFRTEILTDRGADPDRVHTYDGYKEDVYVAGFDPDPDFPDRLPFDGEPFVVVRPEALSATYVDAETSIVPELLAGLTDRGLNAVYLSREARNRSLVPDDSDRVYVPDGALSGLDLAWHARCVLTGSGTMAREAARMETPAVSFFPSRLISVDQALVEAGEVFHSRDPTAIVDYVDRLGAGDAVPDRTTARRVRDEVAGLTADLIDREVE